MDNRFSISPNASRFECTEEYVTIDMIQLFNANIKSGNIEDKDIEKAVEIKIKHTNLPELMNMLLLAAVKIQDGYGVDLGLSIEKVIEEDEDDK